MKQNWMPIIGKIEKKKDTLIFKGGSSQYTDEKGIEQESTEAGLFICDKFFTEGKISVDVKFKGKSRIGCADIILYYDPTDKYTLNAGIGNLSLFSIRHWDTKWTEHVNTGSQDSIEINKTYHIEASLYGSTVTLNVDGVEVLRHTLPYSFPRSQVGLFCVDKTDIEFRNYKIKNVEPKAFVVMQFSSKFNDVYFEVIKSICEEQKIEVLRIDEEDGPGIIIQDISRAIQESKLIIADISPLNANVFYEVGYAHALKKPTILIAEKGTQLPFDVSSFRTLFYENSIGGKGKLETGLRRHIKAILQKQG